MYMYVRLYIAVFWLFFFMLLCANKRVHIVLNSIESKLFFRESDSESRRTHGQRSLLPWPVSAVSIDNTA